MTEKDLARLFDKFDMDEVTGCWQWQRSRDRDGYGRFWLAGRNRLAHTVTYELFRGPIPEKRQLDHAAACCNRACCNPWHTEPVTQFENLQTRGWQPFARLH